MSSTRYLRIKELLLAARELAPPERRAFLERECGAEADLREEVESLLAHEDAMPAILRTGGPAADVGKQMGAGASGPEPGSHPIRIASYRILEVLGVGGMGVVYRAEQTEPIRREVALKRIRHGIRSDRVIARFEAERQTLALMDHPHIAKVLDAGASDDGHPFFVMELVRGDPITDYCDTHRLSIEARLRLFLLVCRAVEHAHRKGIIHRDLKPSNILIVDQDNTKVPKVIDFGIARVIEGPEEAGALRTEIGQPLGTPQYMSPEQATEPGYALDTRTDVYSLGIILYELLTGAYPYDARQTSLVKIARVIREEPPAPLRKLWRSPERLDADLETIVAKVIEKEPQARYQSVAALADDIERLLSGQPILARPPSATYQLRKLVFRHKAAFAFITTIVALLAAFAVTMSILYGAQRRDRARAELQTQKAERINAFLQTMLSSVDPEKAQGRDVTVRDVLAEATLQSEETLAGEPEIRAAVESTLGNTYRSLGLYAEAEPLLRSVLKERQRLLGDEHLDVATAQRDLAELLLYQGSYDEAAALFGQALETRRTHLGEMHADVASVQNDLGVLHYFLGDFEEAASHLREAARIRREVLGPEDSDLGETLSNLAVVMEDMGEVAAAEPYSREALSVIRARLGPDHPDVATAINNLAVNLKQQGRLDEAEQMYREVLAIRRRVQGEEHPLVATTLNNLGRLLQAKGDYEGADSLLSASVAMRRNLFGDQHYDVAEALHNLGLLRIARGRYAEAEALLREALDIRRKIRPEHPLVASTQAQLGDLLVVMGRPAEGEPLLRRALEIRTKELSEDNWVIAFTRGLLGHCLAERGRLAEAEDLMLRSYSDVIESSSAGLAEKRATLEHLVALYEKMGNSGEASRFRAALGSLKG